MISPTPTDEMRIAPQWDAFISHAWEDKESFVRPLAHVLTALGAAVWYDEFSLKLGDSVSASIDRGLAGPRYGIVVLSKAFITKPWPQRELQGLVVREMGGTSKLLPVWHELTCQDVARFSPTLADKAASKTEIKPVDQIAEEILFVIRPDIANLHTHRRGQEPRQGPRKADGPPPFSHTGAAEGGHQTAGAGRYAARIGAQLQRWHIHHPPRHTQGLLNQTLPGRERSNELEEHLNKFGNNPTRHSRSRAVCLLSYKRAATSGSSGTNRL